ncbi:M14 family zinc carboxypeptidase [Nocardia sp. CA-119907]|uniref:M14 family zinc carboxypeptidase n=1 Tax=Nocardia sp. CA-119907 TaxID=3239973 RepID=UPI003D99FE23
MGYLKALEVSVALNQLATDFRATCTRIPLTTTSGGRTVEAVALKNPEPEDRIPVLFVGGVHAREWAPPDALLGFAQRLLTARANASDIVYPEFVSGGISYSSPNYRITAAQIAGFFKKFELIILPLVNPDGRDTSVKATTKTEQGWRKNRRQTTGQCRGVDINRNFPIAWEHTDYYSPAAAMKADISTRPCHPEVYKGPSAGSEIETQNVMNLVTTRKIRAYVDVHMSGRNIQHPWGMERNQTDNPARTFDEAGFNHLPALPNSGRDGLLGDGYSEFINDTLLQRHKAIAEAMRAEIESSAGANPLAIRRSKYRVMQSVDAGIRQRETFIGCSDDWVFSRQFVDQTMPECVAFTIECGLEAGDNPDNPADNDGGFFPNFNTQFPKIEREVHAGLFGLLKAL